MTGGSSGPPFANDISTRCLQGPSTLPPRRDGKASLGTLISAEVQGGYARHGPSALTSRAPNQVAATFDNLIGDLGR